VGGGLIMPTNYYATAIKVEYYDATNDVWITACDVAGNTRNEFYWSYVKWGVEISKIRITISELADPSAFQLVEVVLWRNTQDWKTYFLSRDGGDMYGDIDMNGNDILSPGLVDGVDVSAHAARHRGGGADPLYWNELAVNGPPNLNGYKILNPAGAIGGMVAGVKWVNEVVYDGNPPSSWTELDLSSYVGSRRALCFFRIERPNATSSQLYQIVPADYYNVVQDGSLALGPTSCVVKDHGYGYILTMTDDNGRVRIRSNSGESTDKTRLLCYFTVT